MGKVIGRLRRPSLRKSFMLAVLAAALAAAALSIAAIFACTAVQRWLVPVRDEVMLHVYTKSAQGEGHSASRMRANGEKQPGWSLLVTEGEDTPQIVSYAIEPLASPSYLTPKRWLLYNAMDVGKVALPILFAVAGIAISAFIFYRRKLARPIALLEAGAGKIAANDLDFTLEYSTHDEMGRLCGAFETMRTALVESKREVWAMMEERRRLHASVAHDLRTPITVIKGYAEYLRRQITRGTLTPEKLDSTTEQMFQAAGRLESYVDSTRDINRLQDLPVEKEDVALDEAADRLTAALAVAAETAGKKLEVGITGLAGRRGRLDSRIFARVLENLTANALRYARERVCIEISCADGMLTVSVADDGPGLTQAALDRAAAPFFTENTEEHTGIGLTIVQLLCRKHGGSLTLFNDEGGGARAIVRLSLE